MQNYKIKLLIIFCYGFLSAQTLFMDNKHLIGISSTLLLDGEGVINSETSDYFKEYYHQFSYAFLYSYDSSFNMKLSFSLNKEDGFGLLKGKNYSLSFKYYYKNIISKIVKNIDSNNIELYEKYDFNINFLLGYNTNSFINPCNVYGIGLSKEFKGDNYNSFPELFFMNYSFNDGSSDKRLILEIPVEIVILPKDNIASPDGFWISPSITLFNLKDAVIGISSGFYHNF